MPILLTEPFVHDPGAGQPTTTYTHAKIAEFNVSVRNKTVAIVVQYGNIDEAGDFIWAREDHVVPFTDFIENKPERIGPPIEGFPNGEELPADPQYDQFIIDNLDVYMDLANALYARELPNFPGTVDV